MSGRNRIANWEYLLVWQWKEGKRERMTRTPSGELISSQRPGERTPLVRVVSRCLSSLQLENDDGGEGTCC